MTNNRALIFWFVGSLCIFFGTLIAGNIDPEIIGATTISVVLSYVISFVLIMIGGMFWITTAVAHVEEY
ncbi:MAG: hypothetical protein PHU12_02655 [Candidatus Aenigmarchaeota archaeon]|nr:hypothetical protein [Candidatus Aenigmarchaeota archaeon]